MDRDFILSKRVILAILALMLSEVIIIFLIGFSIIDIILIIIGYIGVIIMISPPYDKYRDKWAGIRIIGMTISIFSLILYLLIGKL